MMLITIWMPNSAKAVDKSLTKTAIFICGPTAIGKTGIAIQLAQWLDTEIISFDSRQFFKELQIGAAPPSEEELEMVPHHLVGQLSVKQDYNAGDFEKDAIEKLDQIFNNSDHAVLVGGSGLYMQALAEGFDEMPPIPDHIRMELNFRLKNEGLETLAKELQLKDPTYWEQVDQKNPQRIIRALEVIYSVGKPYSDLRKGKKSSRNFRIVKIGLNMARKDLYHRINTRVDLMLEQGLEQEVKSLMSYRDKNSMQTVGYKEFVAYFDDKWDRLTAIEEIKKNSRRYAKRQLTWFKRDDSISWFEPTQLEAIKDYLKNTLPTGT